MRGTADFPKINTMLLYSYVTYSVLKPISTFVEVLRKPHMAAMYTECTWSRYMQLMYMNTETSLLFGFHILREIAASVLHMQCISPSTAAAALFFSTCSGLQWLHKEFTKIIKNFSL